MTCTRCDRPSIGFARLPEEGELRPVCGTHFRAIDAAWRSWEATEEWRPVLDWEGLYEVSDHGRVRSLKRRVVSRRNWHESTRTVPAKVLQQINNRGYLRVHLTRDGKRREAAVHRLVLEAFQGPEPQGMESLHGNGNPGDNRLANLRWGTPTENQDDRRRHGRTVGPRPGDTCRNGHEYATGGVYLAGGVRRCRQCQLEWRRKNRQTVAAQR